MLTAPIPATEKALKRPGLSIDEIGAFEVNEAFAPVPLAWLAEVGADPKALNPERRCHCARAPAGRLRRADHDDARAPHARPRHPLRAADHVRGRRPGQRHHSRTALNPPAPPAPAGPGERRAGRHSGGRAARGGGAGYSWTSTGSPTKNVG